MAKASGVEIVNYARQRLVRLKNRAWFSDDELLQITAERAALRRLASLVARGAPPREVLDAVTGEMGRVLRARLAILARYESDYTVTAVGSWNYQDIIPRDSRWPIQEGAALERVWRTGKPARVDEYTGDGSISRRLRASGITGSVACPILVGRSLWGVAIVSRTGPGRFPPDTEQRMMQFTELASASIANAKYCAELRASRARVVAAADESRRRVERDLHDGTQQRLVTIGLQLRTIEAAIPPGQQRLKEQVSDVTRSVQETLMDLQEITRGLHPAVLASGGLPHALKRLTAGSAATVELDIAIAHRLPEPVEVTAYYVVSEALSNVAKYARASLVRVDVTMVEKILRVSVCDDGIGGADPASGSGLIGLADRVEALGGSLVIHSPAGHGTSLTAEIPTTR